MPSLMYLTTIENKKSQDEHWNAFRISQVWLELKPERQYNNTVFKNVKVFLRPIDYFEL